MRQTLIQTFWKIKQIKRSNFRQQFKNNFRRMKYVIIISTIAGLISCSSNSTNNKNNIIKIEPKTTKENQSNSTMTPNNFNQKYQQSFYILRQGMTEYMKEEGVSYTSNDIDKCIKLLTDYLTDISKTTTKAEAMKIVKKTVVALNELNIKCDYQLIETDQREIICEIIIKAGNEKGYNEMSDDITQEWREW